MEKEITTYRKQIKHFMMKPRSVNYKRLHSFTSVKHTFLRASLDGEPKRRIFKKNPWHFNTKAKFVIVFSIIAVMLISIFAFLPKENQSDDPTAVPSPTTQGETPSETKKPDVLSDFGQMINHMTVGATQILAPPKPPGIIESAQTINSTVWKAVAANAWQYFQPGIGVDTNTGLPGGGLGWPYFTDWDLGVYIQAVTDANKTGLINNDGAWSSSARLEKVVKFLETRELNSTTGVPFWFYNAANREGYLPQSSIDVVDSGRLFVALNNLKIFNSSLASRIDNFVYNRSNNGTDYAALVPSIKGDSLTSTSIYAYYVASGFASFFPELSDAPDAILNNMLKAGDVTTYGNVSLPKASISCEPLLCSVFDLNSNPTLMALAKKVYLAHEAYYNETDPHQYVAFSEGNSPSGFIWEWVVLGDDTWKITSGGSSSYLEINPIIYNKVAFSFLALYNTTFARNMVVYLEQSLPDPTSGYSDGADNSKNLVSSVGSNTNGLILSAARYAIQNNP